MANHLPNATYRQLALWLFGRRKRLRVVGESMLPLLEPGDEILFDPHAYQQSKPQHNDLVVALHPFQKNLTIVKRVTGIEHGDRYFIVGDNSLHSTDSRHWGSIKLTNIIGRVTSKFS